MTPYISQTRHGRRAWQFGLAALAVYLIMTQITLPHLHEISGLVPFDLRPMGYGPMQARNLLQSLGDVGREYYLMRQLPLDLLYPPLLALCLGTAIRWGFGAAMPPRLLRAASLLPWAAALADYLENLGIASMILAWPTVPDLLVHATAAASVSKAVLTTVAVLLMVIALVVKGIHRLKRG